MHLLQQLNIALLFKNADLLMGSKNPALRRFALRCKTMALIMHDRQSN